VAVGGRWREGDGGRRWKMAGRRRNWSICSRLSGDLCACVNEKQNCERWHAGRLKKRFLFKTAPPHPNEFVDPLVVDSMLRPESMNET